MQSDIVSMETFAKTLKKLMHERNVTVKVLTQATGLPQSSISEYLAGSRSPTLGEPILKLARFFGVSIEYLITGQHPEEVIMTDILNDLEDGFVSLHKGTYRINIEKYIGRATKREKKKDL